MPSASNPASPRAQLVLLTPPLAAVEPFADRLAGALAAGPVAAVVARLEPADERTLVNRVKALAPLVQGRGAALMVEGLVETVTRGGADGLHLAYDADRLAEAVGRLAPQRMVGVGGLRSRDDAMLAGERGADYVLFGEPIASRRDGEGGRLPPFPAVLERVAWWAELFEVPVVGFAPDMASVAALAAARADFVAVETGVWDHPGGPAAGVGEALAALRAGGAA